VKQGELWTATGWGYAGKPRPVLIVQSGKVDTYDSQVVCLLTSIENESDTTRVRIISDGENGLDHDSYVMVDKIFAIEKSSFGQRIGRLKLNEMKAIREKLDLLLAIDDDELPSV
jgi:mRNA interferase MazF